MEKQPTKQRLVQTAIELIGQATYSRVSVAEICAAADVHKGSFYHHFPSKVDLAIAAIDAYFEENTAEWDRVFSPMKSSLKRIIKICDYIIEESDRNFKEMGRFVGCPLLSLGTEMASEDGEEARLAKRCREADDLYLRYWTSAIVDLVKDGHIEQSADVDEIARLVHVYVAGQMTVAKVHNSVDGFKTDLKKGVFKLLGISADLITQDK